MTFEESLAFLDEVGQSGICLGLDSIRELLKRIGNPQDKLKFVHIAGTNGKGSTLAFTSTILTCAGYRVGRYSSPRVFEFEEFVQVNGENIEREAFCRLAGNVKDAVDSMKKDGLGSPSLFECETAIGFLYFVEKRCDIVILECGMGGRDDATNVVDTVICNIITSIGLDHMGFLGNTLAEIADVKSGIIRNQAPVCIGRQEPEALSVIQERCHKVGAHARLVDFNALKVYPDLEYSGDGIPQIRFDYKDLKNLRIRLLGRYQLDNACLAIEAVRSISTNGMTVRGDAVREGLRLAVWHGRFETIGVNPRVIIDGAHNPHGMKQLKNSLEYYFPGRKLIGIMGVLADKAYDEECEMMAPLFEEFFTITPPNNSRALAAEKLAETLKKYHPKVQACQSIEDACRQARAAAGPEDIIMIFGSLSYIGEASRTYARIEKELKASEN